MPGPGEALVRVVLAGICNTDLEIVRGYMGFRGIPGHEFLGIVEQAPDPEWIGRRVVGEINCPCGNCPNCRQGLGNHCSHRTVLGIAGRDGAFAEYLALPIGNLHEVPPEISDQQACFVEPLAAACRILDQIHIRPVDRVIVLGDGKLGLLAAQVMSLTGASVLAIGKHRSKLAVLHRLGIPTCLAGEYDGGKADVVVECTGSAAGLQAAQSMVKETGTIVLKSTFQGEGAFQQSQIVVDEVRLVGSRCGPFPAALRLLKRQVVDVDPLVDTVCSIEQGPEAFERAGRGDAMKVLLSIGNP
ncbi:MAG: alcohol dehydrogenase catalytic domain-containing protein [Chloroflexi bacterium]|nr:alcohol dehydrogenase catalytic domain-containing protein [Chloroflexota bacterium]